MLWEKEKMLVSSIFSFSHNVSAFSPFPTMFSKGPFLKVVKSHNSVVKRIGEKL